MVRGKTEDADGLTPVKDDNAAPCHLGPRTFVRYFDDCYKVLFGTFSFKKKYQSTMSKLVTT